MNEVTVTKRQKVRKWLDDHTVELAVGAVAVISAGAGIVWGFSLGDTRGFTRGLKTFRKEHCDIAKTILDEAAHEGAFTALKLVRDNKEVYEQLLKEPDAVISKVGELFYNSEYATSMLDVLKE